MTQQVHCLMCDNVFEEQTEEFIDTCPKCGNEDPFATVYLQREDEDDER